MTKFLNISTDNTLGGNSPSDEVVSSQKAVKDYVDNNSGSTTLSGLTDTTISSPSDGQVLTYDGTNSVWKNANNIDISGKVSKTGDTMSGDLQISAAIYLTSVSSSISSTTSKIFFGTPNNPYNYISGSTAGALGIYNSSGKGLTCYPTTNIYNNSTSGTVDLGRSQHQWKDLYISGTLFSGSSRSIGFDSLIDKVNLLPSTLGTAGQALCVDSAGTGLEYKTIGGGGGLTDYNFTHTTNTTVTSPFTFTCAANQRNSQMITTSANLTLNITCNNGSDNYLWIKNSSSSADIDVAIGTVTYNGNTVAASSIYLPSDGITVPKSGLCEIGIIMNADGAFITVRSDLAPSA